MINTREELIGALKEAAELQAAAVTERLLFLEARRGLNFFDASMSFDCLLKSTLKIEDPDAILEKVDDRAPWPAKFWFGAWDADALCGYTMGTPGLPDADLPHIFSNRGVRRENVARRT